MKQILLLFLCTSVYLDCWSTPGTNAPEHADPEQAIDTTVRDTVAIGFDTQVTKAESEIYPKEDVRSLSLLPANPDTLVLTPEIKPRYKGTGTFQSAVVKALPVVHEPIEILGSFIIEKDGTTSGTDDAGIDNELARTVLQVIRESSWQPAMQGGKPVRTVYKYVISKQPPFPRTSKSTRSAGYDRPKSSNANNSEFGKRYLDLNPKRGNYTKGDQPAPDRNLYLEEEHRNQALRNSTR